MRIAIPSYNRYDSINDKSFKVLYDAGYTPNMIDLFVADKHQYKLYKKQFNQTTVIELFLLRDSLIYISSL